MLHVLWSVHAVHATHPVEFGQFYREANYHCVVWCVWCGVPILCSAHALASCVSCSPCVVHVATSVDNE